jgi:NAD-dependent deacetylase
MDRVIQAARVLTASSRAVAFTGAGVSAGSGISTFREPGGIWDRLPIEEYGTAQAFARDPEKVWELIGQLGRDLQVAQPNPAHLSLADLEARGLIRAVITQNIDGLHQRAGSRDVVEYHGTAASGGCTACGRSFGWEKLSEWPPAPRCPECDRILRPDVVLFGDPIPAGAAARADRLFAEADAVLAVGTSLEVAPASWLVMAAARRGVRVIVVDPSPSEVALQVASVVIALAAEVALPEVLDAIGDAEREG